MDATPLLPPTDGSVQVLLQPHADAVSVALNAQLLPLHISVPAVSAVSSVMSALFSGGEEEQQQQQQQQPSQPAPSPAAVAAAATVIIEDAAATLQPQGRGTSLDATGGAAAAAAAAGQHEPALQQPGDDLAAVLFTLVHSSGLGARPAPLQVHTVGGVPMGPTSGRDEAAGLGARLWAAASGGSGRQEAQQQQQPGGRAPAHRLQGIRWCYTQPREVTLLAVEVRTRYV